MAELEEQPKVGRLDPHQRRLSASEVPGLSLPQSPREWSQGFGTGWSSWSWGGRWLRALGQLWQDTGMAQVRLESFSVLLGELQDGFSYLWSACFDPRFSKTKLLCLSQCNALVVGAPLLRTEWVASCLVSLGKFHAEGIGQPHPGPEFARKHQGLVFPPMLCMQMQNTKQSVLICSFPEQGFGPGRVGTKWV